MNIQKTDTISQVIKTIVYNVSKEYLDNNSDMNTAISSLYTDGVIENEEILKRVCEGCNNFVYLTLFKTPGINRSNISFTLADSKGIIGKMNNSTNTGSSVETVDGGAIDIDYLSVPEKTASCRSVYGNGMCKTASLSSQQTAEVPVSKFEQLQVIEKAGDLYKTANLMISMFEKIQTDAEKSVERNIGDLVKVAVSATYNHESIADMSKIAMASVIPDFGNSGMSKMAHVMHAVIGDVRNHGIVPDMSLTKIASDISKVNMDSDLAKLAQNTALEIEKISACKGAISKLKGKAEKLKSIALKSAV